MSTARNPVRSETKRSHDEIVFILREHLDSAAAETMAQRIGTADNDAGQAVDLPLLRKRILERKPLPFNEAAC